jgi:hypothetical protein
MDSVVEEVSKSRMCGGGGEGVAFLTSSVTVNVLDIVLYTLLQSFFTISTRRNGICERVVITTAYTVISEPDCLAGYNFDT